MWIRSGNVSSPPGSIDTSDPSVYFAGFSFGNNQRTNNQGLGSWMHADRSRYPSPLKPGMLEQSGQMGNFYVIELLQKKKPRVPDWISSPNRPSIPENRGIVQTLKGWTTPTIEFLKSHWTRNVSRKTNCSL